VSFNFRQLFTDRESGPDDEHKDLRLHRRHKVFLQASVYPIDTYCDILIRDVSETGLSAETDVQLDVGQAVHLSFDEKAFFTGVVRWVRGRRFGLEFKDAVTFPIGINIDHGFAEGHRPRSARTSLNLTGRITTGRPPRPATVRNVSRLGMLIDTSAGLVTGQHLLVRLGKRPLVSGRVQWVRGGRMGVKTSQEISALQLVYCDDLSSD
jgi:hypothetical protein